MTPRLRLLLAVLMPFIACGVQWLLWDAWIKPYVWFLFFPAAFFSAWLSGLKGGVAGGALGALLAWYVYMPPQFVVELKGAASVASIAMFVVMGVLFGWVFERLDQARRRTAASLGATEAANARMIGLYEQALEHDETKAQFFADATHELRLPQTVFLEQRRKGEQLRASEARFEVTFEQAAIGIALVAPDGRWLRVNPKFCAIVGYTQDELMARTFQDITHPDDLDADLGKVGRMLAKEIDTYSMDKRYFRKDGAIVWIRLTVALVWRADGGPDYFISMIEDISARKRLEATLREREHRLEAIVAHSPSALSLKHPDGRYALANPNLQRIHHTYEAQIVGKTDFDLYPEDAARAFQANDRRVLETLTRHSVEEIVPVDGVPRSYMSHIFPVLDDAGRAEFICRISLDITDRKRADEELGRRLAELERLDRAATGREMQMIALKRQVNELARELGRAAPHDLSFAETPGEVVK